MNGKTEPFPPFKPRPCGGALNHFLKCFNCGTGNGSVPKRTARFSESGSKKLRHARSRDAPGTISDVLSRSEMNGFKSPTFDATKAAACTIPRFPLGIASLPPFPARAASSTFLHAKARPPHSSVKALSLEGASATT